jgi:thiamine-monophosphate kinase
MASSEFEIIKQYFDKPWPASDYADVVYGIGDDCAIIAPPPGFDLVASVDTLVADVHFPASANPYDIACRALAANASDLSAMGASPGWFTLALTLPEPNPVWLASFSEGLFDSARQYGMPLVGGDTTRGPLSITLQVQGYVPVGGALRRDGAAVDDDIYVTGWLGRAGAWLALSDQQKSQEKLLYQHFYRPPSRLDLGVALRGLASAVIDISDGLLADLGHILERSHVGASILLEDIPYSDKVARLMGKSRAIDLALSAGDDYELCFCAPGKYRKSIALLSQDFGIPITRIGKICIDEHLALLNKEGQPVAFEQQGYQHF